MTPVIRIAKGSSDKAVPSLEGKVLVASTKNERNAFDTGGSGKSSNGGYNRYGGQGGFGYGQNDHQPGWGNRPQTPATSALEIVHFTPVPKPTTKLSFFSPSIIPKSPLLTSEAPITTSTFSSPPILPDSGSTSLAAFNLVPSTSLGAPAGPHPSPSAYEHGGIVGGSPSSPTPSPTSSLSPQSDIQNPVPLGIVAAVILGSLFVVVLLLVIYVLTRPKFSRLARFWKRPKPSGHEYQQRMVSIASFEPKEYLERQSGFILPDDSPRPASRSLLLPGSRALPSPRDRDAEGIVLHSPPAAYKGNHSEYSRRSRVMSWRTFTSASISIASRPPSGKQKSITRIMSVLEGYPFQHEISSTEEFGSRSQSPNWSTTDHDYYTRSIPITIPTVE